MVLINNIPCGIPSIDFHTVGIFGLKQPLLQAIQELFLFCHIYTITTMFHSLFFLSPLEIVSLLCELPKEKGLILREWLLHMQTLNQKVKQI